jgi:hypothetical protein
MGAAMDTRSVIVNEIRAKQIRAKQIRATVARLDESIDALEARGVDASLQRMRKGIALIQLAEVEEAHA